jgi:NTP pyrophosphatase (non-canonical NTP hydrolase)
MLTFNNLKHKAGQLASWTTLPARVNVNTTVPPHFDILRQKVVQWAQDRQIIPNSNPTAQLMKTVSELGELADATLKSDVDGIADGVGDVLVTLIIYCELAGVCITECLDGAYATIKDRRGTLTPEGVFVKETADGA